MARHITYVPDCPRCGEEMVKTSMFNGAWTRWWHCNGCGYDTEKVGEGRFDALTAELTAHMREGK